MVANSISKTRKGVSLNLFQNNVWIRDFNDTHPEMKKHETFIGNMTIASFEKNKYITKRIGVISYNSKGQIIPKNKFVEENNLYPVFVSTNEYYKEVKIVIDEK